MALDAERYQLSEIQHQAIFEKRIQPHLSANATSVSRGERPIAIIFGGQPGAGKSASMDDAVSEYKSHYGIIQIIGDDLRGYHPQYGNLMKNDDKTAAFYTDRDSGRWVEKAIDYAKAHRFNVVIEGTMRDVTKVQATMHNLRNAGYLIDARALAVNERLSWQGVLQRYENQKADRGYGRMTTPEAHQAAYTGLPSTVEKIEAQKLADRMTIYRRGGIVIYRNELENGVWKKTAHARQVIEAERIRPMTLQELREYSQGYEKLTSLLAKPERRATLTEVRAIDALRQHALRELTTTEATRNKDRGIDR